MSDSDQNLGFPALNSDVLAAATDAALAAVSATPNIGAQALREYMHSYFGGDTWSGWGEATAVILQQVVIDAVLNGHKTSAINTAFMEDQQMFLESIAYGANIDNPWVLDTDGDGTADAGRAEALDLRIWVLAVSQGGSATDTWNLDDVPVVAVGFVQELQALQGGL
jgi:hypothetical protein